MADVRISDLVVASQLKDDDYYEIAQAESGTRVSYRTTLLAIAVQIATVVQLTSDLTTDSKTLAGAINELKQKISLIPKFSIDVVQTLPTEDISDTTIYLVPSDDPETENAYDEYINLTGTTSGWEKIGSTDIDMSAYYTKLEVDGLLADKLEADDFEANQTASANPITLETKQAGLAKSCVVEMNPIQSGTGDPSPTNIRPISGRTEASVKRTGKNVFNLAKYLTDNNITYTKDGEWFIFSIGSALYANKFTLPELGYYSGQLIIDSTRTVATNVNLRTYKNGSAVTQGATFTNQQIDQVGFNYSTTGQVCCKVQTEYGSTATSYEPYTAETHTHQYGQTVYGGEDDFVNGGLSNEWGYIASYAGETLSGEWLSDRDVYAPGTTPTTGAEVAYKLATPTTIQLSPEALKLLKGLNVISTDGDKVQVEFSDIPVGDYSALLDYVKSLEARIQNLES